MPNKNIIKVLVFGSTGVGKTSLCNVVSGGRRPTNNGPFGVTQKTHVYAPFAYAGRQIQIIDTAGLHESEGGTVRSEAAVKQLVELLQKSRDGFHLLVHVARANRITKQQEEDHDFFVRRMTQSKVPTLLVLTGCENEDPMTSWVDSHHHAFNHFNYKQLVATCFAQGGRLEGHFAPLREQSRQSVLEAIDRHALDTAFLLYGDGTGRTLQDALFSLWNEFVDLAKLPENMRRRTNESGYALLKRLGVPEKLADLAIQHIPDLLGEVGNKMPVPGAGGLLRGVTRRLLTRVLKKFPKSQE